MIGRREPWISDEPRLFGQLVPRLVRRALRRPFLAFGAALLVTVTVVGLRAQRPPRYKATQYFSLEEGTIVDSETTPQPPRLIREYIANIAMSQRQLTEIMEKHHLASRLRAEDPVGAVESLREDIDIDVSRNYFVYDRSYDDEPRSARIALSFWTGDPDLAMAVVRELGAAILREQENRRAAHLTAARTLSRATLQRARERLRRDQTRLERLHAEAQASDRPESVAAKVEAAALQVQIMSAMRQLDVLEKRAAGLELTEAVEKRKLGLNFQLVDEDIEGDPAPLSPADALRLAAVVFVVALGVLFGVIAAWDRRVYTPKELGIEGFPVFGSLPRFPGDTAGSYRQRSGRPRGTRI
jgi:hypothetical protein